MNILLRKKIYSFIKRFYRIYRFNNSIFVIVIEWNKNLC